MKPVTAILGASGLVLALCLPSWAQTKQLPTHIVTVSGTVETIDHDKRVLNIKTADGTFETLDVPRNAKRFDELKVGDKVSATYNNNVSVRLKPPGEPAVDTGAASQVSGGGESARGHDSCGENDDGQRRRYRQERVIDHLRWSERI